MIIKSRAEQTSELRAKRFSCGSMRSAALTTSVCRRANPTSWAGVWTPASPAPRVLALPAEASRTAWVPSQATSVPPVGVRKPDSWQAEAQWQDWELQGLQESRRLAGPRGLSTLQRGTHCTFKEGFPLHGIPGLPG